MPSSKIIQSFIEGNISSNVTSFKGESINDPRHLMMSVSITEKFLVCGFAFTFIVGIIGNCFVCYIFGYKHRKHRTIMETLLLYLGIVDLMASFVNPLLFSYWTLTKYRRWDFGVIGCKIFAPVAAATITISASIIMMISVDRYRAIVSPFKGQFTKQQINMSTCIAIIVSVVPYASYIYYLQVDSNTHCMVKYGGELGYAIPYIAITIIRDVTYLCLFCYTSISISRCLKQRNCISVNNDYSRKCAKESRRITKVLYRIGLVFAALVFPKDLLGIVSTVSWLFPPGIKSTEALLHLNGWFKVLNVSNSCVNVFIYSHLHARFKREISKMIKVFDCKTYRNPVWNQTLTTVLMGKQSLRNNSQKDR